MRATALVAVLLVGGAANAYVLREDSGGHAVRWAGPVSFAVESDLGDKLGEPRAMEAVDASLDTYRAVLPAEEFNPQIESQLNVGYDLTGLAQQNTILVPPEWDFSPDAIAVTVLTVDNQAHQIVDADIALNPNRTFRVLPAEGLMSTNADDIQNALTHELGHAIGLAHNPDLPTAVMFPSARPGETIKRTLSSDDLAGITKLYDLPVPQGCSATDPSPAASAGVLALVLFGLFAFRRKLPRGVGVAATALCLVGPLAARASEPIRPPAPAQTAQAVVVGRVTQVRTLPPAQDRGHLLLFSEITVQVDTCVKGPCPASVVLHVAGGHWGNLEQYVADAPVPRPGATLGLTIDPGTLVQAPAVQKTRLYDLARARDFSAFAQGLSAARLSIQPPPKAAPQATPPGSR